MIIRGFDFLCYLFHEPFWCAGGAADADAVDAFEPFGIDIVGTFDEVGVRVLRLAGIEEHLAVAALSSGDEEDEVVLGGEGADVWHTVGNLSADGVEGAERCLWGYMLLNIADDGMELIERLRCLRIEIDVAGEVEARHLVGMLYDDGMLICLSHETEHLCMSVLAKDDYLGIRRCLILFLYPSLQLKHNGAGGIDDLDVITACNLVGLRRFAMSAEQHFRIMQFGELLMLDGDESHLAQSLTLHTVVDNVAEAV